MRPLANARKYSCLILPLIALPLIAAGIAGSWTGTVTGDEGNPESLHLRLEVTGTAVTGTASLHAGEQFPISEGRLDGNRVAFLLTNLPMKQGVFHFDLTLDGEILRGEIRLTGPEGERHAHVEFKRAS